MSIWHFESGADAAATKLLNFSKRPGNFNKMILTILVSKNVYNCKGHPEQLATSHLLVLCNFCIVTRRVLS